MPSTETRRLGAWLLIGLIVAPTIFFWFLLRKGYGNGLRIAGAAWLAINLAIFAIRIFGERLRY